jgi:hypothetical protein
MNEERSFSGTGALLPRIYEYVLAGLLLAISCGGVMGYHVYHGFITEEIARDRAYWGIGLPFIGLAAGIYIFSYGWQRGDIEKAVRMSMWLTLGAVGIIAAVLGALALRRSAGRGGGIGFLGFGNGSYRRRRRSGWYFGTGYDDDYEYDEYNDPRPIFGRTSPGRAGSIEIHCTKCGEMFVPQAPGGYCPRCGHSAIGRPPQAAERRRRAR